MLCAEIDIAKDGQPASARSTPATTSGSTSRSPTTATGTATDVHVVDDLPDGFDWGSARSPATLTADHRRSAGRRGPDLRRRRAPRRRQLLGPRVGTTDAADCGIVNNTAIGRRRATTVRARPAPRSPINCPDLEVVKDGNGPINGGEDAVFTITVTNHGPGDASDVTLEDQLPAGTWTLGGADAAACEIDGSNLLTCDFGTVDSGDTRTSRSP